MIVWWKITSTHREHDEIYWNLKTNHLPNLDLRVRQGTVQYKLLEKDVHAPPII